MTTQALQPHLFSEVFKALSLAHGAFEIDSAAKVDGFAFQIGGARYQLLPHREDREQAWVEIEITDLASLIDTDDTAQLDHVLRTLLRLNESLLNEHNWMITLDEDDVLVVSSPVSLPGVSAEAIQMQALEGLQRADAVRQLCFNLAKAPQGSGLFERPCNGQYA